MKSFKPIMDTDARRPALLLDCSPVIRPFLRLLAGAGMLIYLGTPPGYAQSPTHNPQRSSAASSLPSGTAVQPVSSPSGGRQEKAQPLSADTGIVHSQRLSSGVPMGGIGTGSFQLLTDGTVSGSTIANNWLTPGGDAPGCFGAVWTQSNGRSAARVLTLNSGYHLPTIAKLDYDGLFPQARLNFPDPSLPVSISLIAFSPLVPFDLKNSSFPGAAMVMRVKNPTTAPMEVSVALSWESLLSSQNVHYGAAIIPSGEGFFGARFMMPALEAEMTLLAYPGRAQATVTTGLWSAKDAHPTWWEQFSREGSVPETLPGATMFMDRPAAVVAVRLTLKAGEATEIPFAVSWHLKHLRTPSGEDVGHYYELPFANAQDSARQLLVDWRSLYGLTEEWQKRLTFSNLPQWQIRRIINAAAPLVANTIHTRDGRFAFLGVVGSRNPDPTPARTANADAPANMPHNEAAANERDETRAHQTAQALLLALFPQLAAQELEQFAVTQDSKGIVLPPADKDWSRRLGPPKPPAAPLVPTADALLANLAPEKPNATRAGAPTPDKQSRPVRTEAPPSATNQNTGQPATPAIPPPSPALAPLDANAAYALQWTQFMLWTGDSDFLKEHFPTLRLALRTLLSANTESFSTASFSNWLAALRGGQFLAKMSGDEMLAKECDAAFKAGSLRMEAWYWNGDFYAEPGLSVPPAERKHAVLPADVCATDQLWGQWLAYQMDLGFLLPSAHLTRSAQSLQQRNDSPARFTFLPPWQIRADGTLPADAPARECLLPASLLADAVLNIWQDRPEVGVGLLSRLDAARNTVLRSPWQYPMRVPQGMDDRETGRQGDKEIPSTIPNSQSPVGTLSTLAVASDWNVLYALQGFAVDINAGHMTLAPNIPGTWRSLIAPVFAPTFWGRMEYRPTAHGGVTTFRLDRLIGFITAPSAQSLRNRAELTLSTLRVQGPPRRANNALPATFSAHVSIGTKPIGARTGLDKDGFVTLTFDSPLTMTAGDRLEVDIH